MASAPAVPESTVPEPSRSTEVARLELCRTAPDVPLDQVFRRACELSANALLIERVGVWLFIDDGVVLRCANLYERSKEEHSAGAVLQVADFPTYFTSLTIRRAVPAEVAASAPWTVELQEAYLKPLGISSMLDAGIFVNGVLVGVVCHEHVGGPREWTTEDRDFAGSVADLLALRIQSAELRELREAFQTQHERVAAQEKASALAQLAAGVAHDFKNLLTVFLSAGQALAIRDDVPVDVHAQARAITDTAERGIALANELVAFARPGARPPAVLNLAELTSEFLPMLQSAVGPRHNLRYHPPTTALGQVLMDRTQYLRLLMNLAINARDAMPDGGDIDLRLAPVQLTGNPNYAGRFIMLEVTDQGVGMDEATRRRIFEPFFTTKSRGMGLGLAIVRQIVDRAGGLIQADSAPARGATFRVYLPRIGACNGNSAGPVVALAPGNGGAY